jgi:hypothetical protein
MEIIDFLKSSLSQADVVKRMAAEAGLMNCIRRMVILTQGIRTEDIVKITNTVDNVLCDIIETMDGRIIDTSPRPIKNSRNSDKKFDRKA